MRRMLMAQRSPLPLRAAASVVSLVFVLLLLPAALPPAGVAADDPTGWEARSVRQANVPARDEDKVARLPASAKLGYHPQTGRVRFISGTPDTPLNKPLSGVAAGKRTLTAADAKGKARKFMDSYGSLFGLRDPARELRVRGAERTLTPASGKPRDAGAGLPNATVRFDQVRDGVPVMGGQVVVQLDEDGAVLSAAGEVLPSASSARTRAGVSAGRARTVAAGWVARELGRSANAVATSSEGLAHYDPELMDDPVLATAGTRLVWRIDARTPSTPNHPPDHRLVIVDARSGQVLTTIGRQYGALERRVCDNKNRAGGPWICNGPFARVEGQSWVGQGDVDAAYRHMGVVYDYFRSRFGRDGIDGNGARMRATVRYCPSYGCPWRNAEWRWGPQQATFGRGWAKADDIVAHEFTHGILDHEAPLFYHYQSGAINESYADVFGELIDLAYSGGTDTAATRWKIGEDTPIGWFRDMKNPPRKGHPDRVRSPKWHTSSTDYGGVHRNNGVGNKAAYLMTAGGTFRGYAIKGIGREKTARIWYHALTTRLTSAANYVDLADALISACTDLAGSNGITFGNCTQVRRATRATEMNLRPKRLAPASAPVCGSQKSPIYVLRDGLEDPASGDWAYQRTVGSKRGWYWPQNPNGQAGWDGTWGSGEVNFYAPNYGRRMDSSMRTASPVVLPARAYLRFGHGYSFDKDSKRRYDGGIVEIKVDGGPWKSVSGLFTHGSYNGTLAKGRGNPAAGKRAYTGNSRGWATARVDLSKYAGSRIKVRFRMVSDRRVGGRGWYVDDIRIYTCARDTDRPTGSLVIDGGAGTTRDRTVRVDLTYDDATTWVDKARVSNSPKLNGSGLLKKGVTMSVRDTFRWDLGTTRFGASGQKGARRVYAQVRDAAGNWSRVFSDGITWQ